MSLPPAAPAAPAPTALPPGLHAAADHESAARERLDPAIAAWLGGGTGQDAAVHRNRAAFDRWQVLPRLLRPLTHGHTRQSLGAQALAHPFALAPVAWQCLVHPGGERETACAADATDTLMLLSCAASTLLEDVAPTAGGAPRWFQLYLQPRREDTLALVRRAEAAGYGALVLTLDATLQSPSLQALRAGFRVPDGVRAVNLPPESPAPAAVARGQSRLFQGLLQHAPTLDDLHWLLAHTRLPLWAKGVMHPDDARALLAAGASGLVVSNHGGRTLDSAPASLTMLPLIRRAVGPEAPLLLDGGVRSGSDAFKALALGANAVAIGRPQLWALANAGALGVAHLIRLLREELELTMALAGCATLAEIGPHCLHPADD